MRHITNYGNDETDRRYFHQFTGFIVVSLIIFAICAVSLILFAVMISGSRAP
jgi:hypothetical protein